MSRRLWSVLFLAAGLGLGLSAQARPGDESEIRNLIGQFSLIWTSEDGAAIFNRVAVTEGFLHLSPQGANNRTAFLAWLAGIKSGNTVVRHTHQVHRIIFANNLAYEYGTVEVTMKNGAVSTSEVMNLFLREPAGWRLLLSSPGKPLEDLVRP